MFSTVTDDFIFIKTFDTIFYSSNNIRSIHINFSDVDLFFIESAWLRYPLCWNNMLFICSIQKVLKDFFKI